MDLINELSKYGITERGNTALINHETGSCLFYSEVEEDSWLEVSFFPENYPSWNIQIVNKTKSEMRTHIEENFCGWYMQKNNIGANVIDNEPLDLECVMECVRDHLYVYRDNKDFETKDTVTSIHDFLESKEWTLDITDIETLRQEADAD